MMGDCKHCAEMDDTMEQLSAVIDEQTAEIERLRAVLTLVQNIVFDAVEDVSTNRADGDTRFERAIIDLDVMLNGGEDA
jgi:uncharacterized coiled-coil protein SlyX